MASPEVDVEMVKRYGFSAFVKLAWHVIEEEELVYENHMGVVCDHLQAVSRGEIKKLVVNVPPGTSKSRLCSVLFNAWDWIENPWRKFLYTSFDEKLSHEFAKITMDLISSEWFQARWPHVQIKGDRPAAGWFHTIGGGQRVSTMFGGGATGRHAHFLFVDDPHKPRDLDAGGESAKAVLDAAWKVWTGTFLRRVANAKTFAYVCIMQRLHEEDLAGKILRNPDVVHVSLPMKFEPDHACVTKWGRDWRTEKDELLCPLRFPAEYVHDVEHSAEGMTPMGFAAQMQQRPTPAGGALFKTEYFAQRWTNLPIGGRYLMSVDASLKDLKDSDYCVIQVWYYLRNEYYLVDQVRKRMAFSATVDEVKRMKETWPKIGQVLIEDKANGTAIVDVLKQNMAGVLAVNPEGGKYSRASAVEPFMRAMNCWFPTHASWMNQLIEEHTTFPVGSHDDTVDALSQALLFMSGKKKGQRLKKAMAAVRAGAMAARPSRTAPSQFSFS
jgi:predicted phage terminase large subunit-like protein